MIPPARHLRPVNAPHTDSQGEGAGTTPEPVGSLIGAPSPCQEVGGGWRQPARLDPCHECDGDGYIIDMHGTGTFDHRLEAWHPTEELVTCEACRGGGEASPTQQDVQDDLDPEYCPRFATPAAAAHPDYPTEPDLPF